MTDGPAKRRPRWVYAAAAVVLLPLAYPLSQGPARYCEARGWLGGDAYDAAYTPIRRAVGNTSFGDAYFRYVDWWGDAGFRHRR